MLESDKCCGRKEKKSKAGEWRLGKQELGNRSSIVLAGVCWVSLLLAAYDLQVKLQQLGTF